MSLLNSKKRLLSIFLAAALLSPYATLAEDATYNFTNIDIPVSTVKDDGGKYTEDLWNVSDQGVFDEKGDQVTTFDSGTAKSDDPTHQAAGDLPKIPDDPNSLKQYQQTLMNDFGSRQSVATARLSGLKQNIEEQKSRFAELESKIQSTEEKLAPVREEVTQLQDEINLINDNIRFTKEKMTNAEILIAQKQIEIKDSMLFLQRSEVELGIQKKVVLDYVKLLYGEESRFFDMYDGSASAIKLLLTDSTVSENLLGREYFEIMEQTGRQVFHNLDETRQKILAKQDDMLKEQEDLNFLYQSLEKEKRTYEEARLSKKDLLEKTKGQEDQYQLLLEQSVQEQLQTSLSVQNLQQDMALIEGKLDLLDNTPYTPQTVANPQSSTVSDETAQKLADVTNAEQPQEVSNSDGKPFSWPIPPNKITTLFHDPSYPKKWGLHQAVDIRAKQFTEIKAPANGYVFQTKDNGMGYSYIILAHKNNLVTVYGHVSSILVKAGTLVHKGDVIGLSGGTPGTKGAGLQTTGAHLHFEVHYKGKPVNPLDYLSFDGVPIEYIPDEYLKGVK